MPSKTAASVSHRGVLRARAGAKRFQLVHVAPAEDLAPFVERHWIVRWDLRGRDPYAQETLPQPCVNMVVGSQGSGVHGVCTRRFSILLEGRGEAVGTKFKPGAFYPFVGYPVSQLTDRALSFDEAFATAPLAPGAARTSGAELERAVLAEPDVARQLQLVAEYLRPRLPPRDDNVDAVVRVVQISLENREITTVEQLAARASIPERTLQRLFRRYVGVSPKWVIQRHRLHEAVSRAEEGTAVDWAALAGELGYCDQAHFIRDFKAHVGRTPAEHAAQCERLAAAAAAPRASEITLRS